MMSHQRQIPLLQFVGLLFQRAPMFRVALAMAFGILLGEYLPAVPIWLLCLVAVVGVGLMSSSTYLFQSNACFTLSLWLTFVAMGWLLVPLHAPADPFAGHTQLRNIALQVRLEETPRPTTRCYKVPAQVSAVAGNPTRGKLMLFIARDSLAAQLRAGDCLQLVATPRLRVGGTTTISSTTDAISVAMASSGRAMWRRAVGIKTPPAPLLLDCVSPCCGCSSVG